MNPTESSVLNAFDFTAIEEMDPSLADNHRIIYDREVPFELRIQDANTGPQEVGTLEAVKTKLLILGEENNPSNIRIELTSEQDLFFHYVSNIDESVFKALHDKQKLMVEFQEFPIILIKMLNSCVKEPHSFLAVFIMEQEGSARLDFIQNIEYKFIELLSVEYRNSPEEIVRQHIAYRYNSVKSKLALMQARLQDITALVKIKNPSLLLQLQKAPQGPAGQSMISRHKI